MKPVEVPEHGEKILSIEEAAELVPHSLSQLYRVARRGADTSPFRKVAGRWCTTQADLVAWVKSGQRGIRRPGSSSDPIPAITRRRAAGGTMRAKVFQLRGREAA